MLCCLQQELLSRVWSNVSQQTLFFHSGRVVVYSGQIREKNSYMRCRVWFLLIVIVANILKIKAFLI